MKWFMEETALTKVIGTKHQLKAILCQATLGYKYAGIVHKNIKPLLIWNNNSYTPAQCDSNYS